MEALRVGSTVWPLFSRGGGGGGGGGGRGYRKAEESLNVEGLSSGYCVLWGKARGIYSIRVLY